MVPIFHCSKKHRCAELIGKFCDASHYDLLISEEVDCYGPRQAGGSKASPLFNFRKQVFTHGEERLAYEALRPAAVTSNGRGAAAGPRTGEQNGRWVTAFEADVLCCLTGLIPLSLDDVIQRHALEVHAGKIRQPHNRVWRRSKIVAEFGHYDEGWFELWLERVRREPRETQVREANRVLRFISSTTYGAPANSGIVGCFGRTPRIPYGRAAGYTEKNRAQFAKCHSFIRKADKLYQAEMPERWKAQRGAADSIDGRFAIASSVFTTLTVNHNFRTAAHLDDGDLRAGFSVIAAFTGPDQTGWHGGEFVLPEYRVAIRLEPRDLLLVDSHSAIHANAPLTGDNNDRLTVVAYFREDMLRLKSWRYERLREQFVKERGRWRGMWRSQAWAEYLADHKAFDEDGLV